MSLKVLVGKILDPSVQCMITNYKGEVQVLL